MTLNEGKRRRFPQNGDEPRKRWGTKEAETIEVPEITPPELPGIPRCSPSRVAAPLPMRCVRGTTRRFSHAQSFPEPTRSRRVHRRRAAKKRQSHVGTQPLPNGGKETLAVAAAGYFEMRPTVWKGPGKETEGWRKGRPKDGRRRRPGKRKRPTPRRGGDSETKRAGRPARAAGIKDDEEAADDQRGTREAPTSDEKEKAHFSDE